MVWRKNIKLKWVKPIWQISRTAADIYFWMYSEAVVQWCSIKKVFFEISYNSQKNTSTRFCFLIKLAHGHSCEFCEISKNTFFIEHLWWLLLNILQHHGFPGQSANQFSKTLTSFTYDGQMFVSTITHDFFRQSMTDPSGHKTKTELWPKRKILLFPKIRVTSKNFTRAATIFLFFFNQFNWIF